MVTDNSASIVSKVPPSPRLRRTGGNYPPSLSKLWRTGAHVLKNAGVGYGDCIEQITYLLFLKPASETPWTQDLWIYDLRTNQHFTLKTNPLANKDLDDFKAVYQPSAFAKRKETERFKKFTYAEIVARDKANLDILWLKDDSLEDSDNLPAPALLAAEIVESLEAALAEFRAVEEALISTED